MPTDVMRDRVNQLEGQNRELMCENQRIASELETERSTVKALQKQLEERTLSLKELDDCEYAVVVLVKQTQEMIEDVEKTILDFVESPDSEEFCDAVARRKDYKKDLSYYVALADRLKNAGEKIRAEMQEQLATELAAQGGERKSGEIGKPDGKGGIE